jgi:hypothetical protein
VKRAAAAAPAKKQAHFEFGGPAGAVAIMISLPLVCYALVRFCHADGCLSLAPLAVPPPPEHGAVRASFAGTGAYVAWVVLCTVLHLLLPGARVQGTMLRDGSRLTYKLNGAARARLRGAPQRHAQRQACALPPR